MVTNSRPSREPSPAGFVRLLGRPLGLLLGSLAPMALASVSCGGGIGDGAIKGVPLTYELYDLEADPGETHNLFDRRDVARKLRSRLFAWVKESKRALAAEEGANQSEETLEALKALGYLN